MPPHSTKLMTVGRYVGRSVDQMVSEIICHRAFTCIFHLLIRLGKDKILIDFGFTRSNFKVTMVTFVKKMVSALYLDNYLS